MSDPLSIFSSLKSVWDAIRGTKEVKKINNDWVMDRESRKDFLNNNPKANIFYIQGDLYMGDMSQLEEIHKEKIKKVYSTNSGIKQEFDVIKFNLFNRVQDFKKSLPDNKSINPFLKFLDYDLKTILNLSIYAKRLFDSGEGQKAQKIRDDIGKHYGKDGRKLCNLYLSGYIDGMTEFLIQEYSQDTERVKEEINQKIKRFVLEADYIFFIHQASNAEEILEDIKKCIKQEKPYIAIHGAGPTNIKKVREIILQIEDELTSEGYDINEENKRTLSLCPLLYVYLTKKVSL